MLQELSTSRGKAPCAEESLELGRTLFGEHAAEYVDAMIETRQSEHIDDAAGCARALIPRPEHEAAHARVHDSRSAHDAWLQRYIERRVIQAIVAQRAPCGA